MANAGKPVIVFPPGLSWEGQVFQRPQHIAENLARMGALVFYCQPEHLWAVDSFRQIDTNLYLCHVRLEAFDAIPDLWVHIMTWNAQFLHRFQNPKIIYDWVDAIDAFEGQSARLHQQHAAMLASANVILASSNFLYEQAKIRRPDAVLCANGVDYEFFAAAWRSPLALPVELDQIRAQGKPVIGYTGALAGWFDAGLLKDAAEQCPDFSFVLVGPLHGNRFPLDELKRKSNIHYLGFQPYRAMPAYLQGFDAAMIPFHVNEVTNAVSPIKLFEYLAAHRPVVSTLIREALSCPGVLTASSPVEFCQQIERALQIKNTPEFIDEADRVARQSTWHERAKTIFGIINQL